MRRCPHCRRTYSDELGTCPEDGMPLLPVSGRMKALSADTSNLKPGTMISEFMVEEEIGRGGMGVIYRGIHPVIHKRVAIKVLGHRFASDPKAVGRFVLEARTVNEVGHHNIVDIFSIGELDDGRNYMVMELIDGIDLSRLLARVGRFSPGELVPVFEQVCDALSVVHEKGFVHRDIKPENIFILRRPPRPQVKILDFGIAKLRHAVTPSQTEIGTVMGTPEYMSPEQCRGVAVDHTSDIYSLGVTLYELVTGRKPFSDAVAVRVLTMQIEKPPQPPSELCPTVTPALERVILRALGKHPSDRQASTREFFEQLQAAIPTTLNWTTNLEPDEDGDTSARTLPPFPLGANVVRERQKPASDSALSTILSTEATLSDEDADEDAESESGLLGPDTHSDMHPHPDSSHPDFHPESETDTNTDDDADADEPLVALKTVPYNPVNIPIDALGKTMPVSRSVFDNIETQLALKGHGSEVLLDEATKQVQTVQKVSGEIETVAEHLDLSTKEGADQGQMRQLSRKLERVASSNTEPEQTERVVEYSGIVPVVLQHRPLWPYIIGLLLGSVALIVLLWMVF